MKRKYVSQDIRELVLIAYFRMDGFMFYVNKQYSLLRVVWGFTRPPRFMEMFRSVKLVEIIIDSNEWSKYALYFSLLIH